MWVFSGCFRCTVIYGCTFTEKLYCISHFPHMIAAVSEEVNATSLTCLFHPFCSRLASVDVVSYLFLLVYMEGIKEKNKGAQFVLPTGCSYKYYWTKYQSKPVYYRVLALSKAQLFHRWRAELKWGDPPVGLGCRVCNTTLIVLIIRRRKVLMSVGSMVAAPQTNWSRMLDNQCSIFRDCSNDNNNSPYRTKRCWSPPQWLGT